MPFLMQIKSVIKIFFSAISEEIKTMAFGLGLFFKFLLLEWKPSIYLGIAHLCRKFIVVTENGTKKHPSGPLWVIGIYAATFGIASQIYENHLDRLENRATILITALLNKETGRLATLQVEKIKEIEIPVEPIFIDPPTIFNSLIGVTTFHKPTIDRLNEAEALLDKDLAEKDLSNSNFMGANLEGANLERANLEGANFFRANLKGARLERANLFRAKLEEANLYKSNLKATNLKEANLKKAYLFRANLEGANLQAANLKEGNLFKANLYEANFKLADLEKANLEKTDVIVANFKAAHLFRANLEEANLFRANLSGAYLEKANLKGAKNLTCKQIQSARIDRGTFLPDYIKITWAEDDTFTCQEVEKDENPGQ